MFTMRLDLSLCGMWYCGAPVLLVGVFFKCRVLALPPAYCVMCTMYVAACSIRVLVYSALLHVATVSWLRPCWEKFIGSPKLGWVIVILSVGRVLLGLGSWIIFIAFGVSAGHQRFCWGLRWNRQMLLENSL